MQKNRLVKYLKTENFSVLIDQASIEYQSSQVDSNQKFLIAILINRETDSIDQKSRKKDIFEKQSNFMYKLLKA